MEETAMGDTPQMGSEVTATDNAPKERTWRSAFLGTGVFLILAALFVGAAFKQSEGMAPKLLAGIGFASIVVGIVGNILASLKAKWAGAGKPSIRS
jgi:hypothetical protein